MTRRAGLLTLALVLAAPAASAAQTMGRATPAVAAPTQGQTPEASRLWIAAGGGSTSWLTDCTECGDPETYRHTGGLLVNAGRAISPRLDFGVEVLWAPGTTMTGDPVRSAFVLAATQFRPWTQHGYFVKAGMGIAFIRNQVTVPDGDSGEFVTKAFGVAIGTGWEWRLRGRWGAQVFGAMHAAAAGDILTSSGSVQNVMANFWTVGGAIVVR